MKKLLILLLIFSAFNAKSQTRPFQNDPAYGRQIDGYKVRKVLFIPTTCGVPGFRPYDLADQSAIAFDTCGHQFYIYDPSTKSWNIGSQSSIDSILSGYYTKSQIDSITANVSGTDSSAYHDVGQAPDSSYFTLIRPNGTKDTIPLPFVKKTDTSITVISHEGVGLQTIYASGSDTIHAKNLQAGSNITITPNSDSSLTISASVGGSVGNADSLNHVVGSDYVTRPELQDTAAAIRADFPTGGTWGSITGTLSDQTDLQSALNAKQDALTLTTTGTSGAATLSGSTLNIPQYSGGGGGTTADSTLTATAGQTAFTFSSVPASYSDYEIFVNGSKWIPVTGYTTSGNIITLTSALADGDLVNYKRVK